MTEDHPELNFVEIMKKLQNVAEADGEVTDEEEEFLQKLSEEVKEYEKAVKEAELDETISDYEFQDMVISRDRILSMANDAAETDSEDLKLLANELWKEIEKYTLPGMKDDEIPEEEIEEL